MTQDTSEADLRVAEAQRLEVLTSIVASIAHSPDLDSVLSTALDAVLRALDLEVGGIYLVDPESGTLRVTPHRRGVPDEYAEAVAQFRIGEALIGRSLDAPRVVEDLSAEGEAREATRRLGLRSIVFVPLYARGRAVGMMPVGGFRLRRFGLEEVRLLEAVGGMLGGAIENARLLARTQRHLDLFQALWEIDRAIVEDRDLKDVLGTIAREAALLGGGDAAIVLLEGEREVRVASSHGLRALRALEGSPSFDGLSLASRLLAGEASSVPLEAEPGARTFIVPLRAGTRALGGLVVVKSEVEMREDDLAILGTFGYQTSVALAKARVRDVEDRRAGQLALVSAASEIAASTLDLEALLGRIARYIQRSFGYYGVAVYLIEPEAREAVLAGAAGATALMPRGHAVRFGAGIIGWVAEHGEYVLANDVSREPRFVRAGMEGTLSELAVPVRLAGEIVAVINVESDRLDAFDEGDVVALDAIAAQIAAAVRNARLFREKVRALRNLEILQEITNVLNSELELQALLDRIARRSVEAVRPAQLGAVLLHDGNSLRVRSSYGYTAPAALERVRLEQHEGLPGSVYLSGQGRIASSAPEDLGREAASFREAAGGADPKSVLAVPVALPHQKLGVLLLQNCSSTEAFDADALRFATTLAHQAAIAIGNALRVEKILELDRHRQNYLSNVSHELRTPLTVVQGYLETVLDGTAGDRAATFLQVALQQCQRLGRMIDEVLEVSRLERGVVEAALQWGPVRLGATVKTVLRGLEPELRAKQIQLVESLAGELPEVTGDERLLQLLVLNLLENAIKFTPAQGAVEVALTREGDEVALSVADSGIGIPSEHRDRIFEKFFMVDEGLNRSRGGAGIGLFLAREIAGIHAGSISVVCPPSGGSRFVTRLPVRRPA